MTKNTIEERILRRAQQKQRVQTTVYSGEVFKANFFSSNEVVNLFFDEDELTQHKNDFKIIKDKTKEKDKVSQIKTLPKIIESENNQNGTIKIESL